MDLRTRLTNWGLPALLLGVPLCAALALEHASAAGMKERSRNHPPRIEATNRKAAAPTLPPGGPQTSPHPIR
jgi:hypothetical protein